MDQPNVVEQLESMRGPIGLALQTQYDAATSAVDLVVPDELTDRLADVSEPLVRNLLMSTFDDFTRELDGHATVTSIVARGTRFHSEDYAGHGTIRLIPRK